MVHLMVAWVCHVVMRLMIGVLPVHSRVFSLRLGSATVYKQRLSENIVQRSKVGEHFMKSDEFVILHQKLDRILALLEPMPPKVREIVEDHHSDELDTYYRLDRIHDKRTWQLHFPVKPEVEAKFKAEDEAMWQAMLDDGTITSEERALVERLSKTIDKQS